MMGARTKRDPEIRNADNFPIHFGEAVCKYRKKKKMSQNELAEKMSVTNITVLNWEKGKTLPDAGMVRNIALALDAPLYDLFDIQTSPHLTESEQLLLEQYRQMSDEHKELLLSVSNAVLGGSQKERHLQLREKYILLPLQATPAAAGVGVPDTEMPPEPCFVRGCSNSQSADMIVRVSGDSMEPAYYDGEYVYVKETQSVRDDEDVVCIYHEGFIIKHHKGRQLFSLNSKRDFGSDHEYDDIRVIGRVLGKVDPEDLPKGAELRQLREVFAEDILKFEQKHHINDYAD